MKTKDYQLTTTYACGLLVLQGTLVTDTAPVYKWMKGKTIMRVIDYLIRASQFVGFEELKDEN